MLSGPEAFQSLRGGLKKGVNVNIFIPRRVERNKSPTQDFSGENPSSGGRIANQGGLNLARTCPLGLNSDPLPQETPMPNARIDKLSTHELVALRSDVERVLAEKRRQIERELSMLSDGRPRSLIGNGDHPLKGRKVRPKYRGPNGELWSGRGATPRWLTPLLRRGKKIDAFRID